MKRFFLLIISLMIFTACNKTEETVATPDPVVVEPPAITIEQEKELGSIAVDETQKLSVYVKDPETSTDGSITGSFYLGLFENGDLSQEINLSTRNPFAGDGGGIPIDATMENNLIWYKENGNFGFLQNEKTGLYDLSLDTTKQNEPMVLEVQLLEEGRLTILQ